MEIAPLLVAILGGLVAAYVLVKGTTALLVIAIFASAILRSPVRHDVKLSGMLLAVAKLGLCGAVLAAAAALVGTWIDFSATNANAEIFALVAAMMLFGMLGRLPQALQLARLCAWEQGFAEEFAKTPLTKRPQLMKEWTRLRLGERHLG